MRHLFQFLICLLLLFPACTNVQEHKQEPFEDKERPARKKAPNILSGKVIGISDGDTFKLLTEENETVRVRLYGIDAPEKAQDYGTQARQKLSELIFSREIEVEQKNKDRYGRIVGIAYVNGLNVNEELLRSGLVWHYTDYDKSERWAALQEEAREEQRGLWNKRNPTPPWQWRKQKRKPKAAAVEEE